MSIFISGVWELAWIKWYWWGILIYAFLLILFSQVSHFGCYFVCQRFFPPKILYFFIKLYNETSYFSLPVYNQVSSMWAWESDNLLQWNLPYVYLEYCHRSLWGRNTLFKALVPDLWGNLDILSYLLSTNPGGPYRKLLKCTCQQLPDALLFCVPEREHCQLQL